LRKGIANDFIIAIPFCNSKSCDLGQFGICCTNVPLRKIESGESHSLVVFIIMSPSNVSSSSSPIPYFEIDPEKSAPLNAHEETSPQSTGPYQYSDGAPIKEISPHEVSQVADDFVHNVGEYATDHQGRPVSAELSHDPSAAEKWNTRSDDAKAMASDIKSVTDPASEELEEDSEESGKSIVRAFTYSLGDDSVAMMALEHSPLSDTEITHLATHPATSGAGKTMVAKAVNESQAAGNHGKVWLSSISPDSMGFYRSLGFKTVKGERVELNPSDSPLWSQAHDGKWRLKEHEGSGFLSERTGNVSSKASDSKRPREEESDEAPSTKRPHIK
jgi:hypothetical protein